jgi:hypothetical protein
MSAEPHYPLSFQKSQKEQRKKQPPRSGKPKTRRRAGKQT